MFLYEQSRGRGLPGIYDTPKLLAKEKLFVDHGWQIYFMDKWILTLAFLTKTKRNRYQRAVAWVMLRVYSDFVDAQERHMIERLELFDEFEEWHKIQASKSPIHVIECKDGLSISIVFIRWHCPTK